MEPARRCRACSISASATASAAEEGVIVIRSGAAIIATSTGAKSLIITEFHGEAETRLAHSLFPKGRPTTAQVSPTKVPRGSLATARALLRHDKPKYAVIDLQVANRWGQGRSRYKGSSLFVRRVHILARSVSSPDLDLSTITPWYRRCYTRVSRRPTWPLAAPAASGIYLAARQVCHRRIEDLN